MNNIDISTLDNPCLLLDLEGMIISKEGKILEVPTEISYMIFDKDIVVECYSARLKYDLRKHDKRYCH